jgi:hypothetical protein
MRAEFEIDEEKKRPIGTCAVQRKTFKPIVQGDSFSVISVKALPQYLGRRLLGIGNQHVEDRIY